MKKQKEIVEHLPSIHAFMYALAEADAKIIAKLYGTEEKAEFKTIISRQKEFLKTLSK